MTKSQEDIKTSDNKDRLRKGSNDKRKGTSETLVSHETNWRGDSGKQFVKGAMSQGYSCSRLTLCLSIYGTTGKYCSVAFT